MMPFLKLSVRHVEISSCKILQLNDLSSHVKWLWISRERARRFRKQAAPPWLALCAAWRAGALQRLRPTWDVDPQLGVRVLLTSFTMRWT
jgi:hypothetical protein